MTGYLFNTFKEIFPVKEDEKIGHIVTDKTSRVLLNRFYNLDQLVLKGVVAVFDISTMIQQDKEDKLTAESKDSLFNNNVLYLIQPPESGNQNSQNQITKEQMMNLLRMQLKYFGREVKIVFTQPIDDQILEDIAQIDGSERITSIRSFPFDPKMFTDRAILSDSVPPIIKNGYHIISSKSSTSNQFNNQLKTQTENIMSHCNGRYSTLVVSLPRSFDSVTPYMIPWFYQSMIAYYLNLDQDIVYSESGEMILSINTDRYFNHLKHLSYDVVPEKINHIVKQLTATSEELSQMIKEGSITREKTHEHIENNKNLASIRCHIKILDMINEKVQRFEAIHLSNIQFELLNGMSAEKFEKDMTEFVIKTSDISGLKENKPLIDVLNLASVLRVDTKILIDGSSFQEGGSDQLDLDTFVDPSTKDDHLITADVIKSELVKNTVRGIMTINTKFETKPAQPAVNYVTTYGRGYSLCDKKQNNPLLGHVPILRVILELIADPIIGTQTTNFKINPTFIDMKRINGSYITGVETIIVHIDDFVSLEELRCVESFLLEHKKHESSRSNRLNIIVHSNKVK